MKVGSLCELKGMDKNLFFLWLKTLPVNLSERLSNRLWKDSKEKAKVIWTKYGGFFFY